MQLSKILFNTWKYDANVPAVCQLSIRFLCLEAGNENISSECSSRRIFQKAELFERKGC